MIRYLETTNKNAIFFTIHTELISNSSEAHTRNGIRLLLGLFTSHRGYGRGDNTFQ